MFPPKETFETLFVRSLNACFECYLGLDTSSPLAGPDRVLRDQMVSYVARSFIRGWDAMRADGLSAAGLYKTTLESASIRPYSSVNHSNVFCAYCLTCRPEHVFKCRHAVCDRCVERFGARRTSEEYTYEFTDCFCGGNRADLLVRLKPPTAGLRVIGLDGGGLRGIVSLEFIGILQKSLGSSCQVQDLFDLALGTSVGMCVMRRNATQSDLLTLLQGVWKLSSCSSRYGTSPTRSRPFAALLKDASPKRCRRHFRR